MCITKLNIISTTKNDILCTFMDRHLNPVDDQRALWQRSAPVYQRYRVSTSNTQTCFIFRPSRFFDHLVFFGGLKTPFALYMISKIVYKLSKDRVKDGTGCVLSYDAWVLIFFVEIWRGFTTTGTTSLILTVFWFLTDFITIGRILTI